MKFTNYLFVVTVVFTLFLSSCAKQTPTITGTIKGLGNDTIFIEYMTLSKQVEGGHLPVTDTIVAENDSFSFYLAEDENTTLLFMPKNLIVTSANGRPIQSLSRLIFLVANSNDKITIIGDIEKRYLNYEITGTKFNEELSKNRAIQNYLDIKLDSLEMLIDYYCYGDNNFVTEGGINANDSIVKSLYSRQKEFFNDLITSKLAYIKNNLESDLSAYYLYSQPVDTFIYYYDKLGEKAKNGLFDQQLKQRSLQSEEYRLTMVNKEKIMPGAEAPDFTLKNLNGEDVTLSGLKGKFLVLDFWGSWCGWCVHGFPRMRDYYDKYNDKLEFIGIACQDTDEKWRKAVENNNLNWIQLFNPKTDIPENNIAVMYAVQGYPSKIIIDEDFKIVEVFIGEGDDFYKKLDEILN